MDISEAITNGNVAPQAPGTPERTLLVDITAIRERVCRLEEQLNKQAQAIEALKAENLRLQYQIARSRYSEKDWQTFDPAEYTVSADEMLNNARKRVAQNS